VCQAGKIGDVSGLVKYRVRQVWSGIRCVQPDQIHSVSGLIRCRMS
jgi:hypothetical protein